MVGTLQCDSLEWQSKKERNTIISKFIVSRKKKGNITRRKKEENMLKFYLANFTSLNEKRIIEINYETTQLQCTNHAVFFIIESKCGNKVEHGGIKDTML